MGTYEVPEFDDTQSTVPTASEHVQAWLEENGVDTGPPESDDTQSTLPIASERVQAWLEENGVDTGPYETGTHQPVSGATVVPVERTIDSKPRLVSERLKQGQLDFNLWGLRWNTHLRLIFRHMEGNSAIKLNTEAAQEICVQPPGILRQPDGSIAATRIIGAVQNTSEVKCTLQVKSIRCQFYYVPSSDNVVLLNTGMRRITLRSSSDRTEVVGLQEVTELIPGCWELLSGSDAVELQLLPCNYFLETEGKPSAAGKRPFGSITKTAQTQAVSRQGASTMTAWNGTSLQENQVVKVASTVGDVEYSMRRLTSWVHKNDSCEAFIAALDDRNSEPEVVVVKILSVPAGHKNNTVEVTRQAADRWRKEFQAHRRLQHPRIAGLRGWDARILSLFVEYKHSKDLASDYWREKTGYFRGDTQDARCIIAHISSALQYLTKEGIVHNDIKPQNILYTRGNWPASGPYPPTVAGAVLIDFGLATSAEHFVNSGTPWYIAPEFLAEQRGPPSDIWSLGVVMLYAMRRIPLPGSRGTCPGWRIAHIQSRYEPALQAMGKWQEEIRRQYDALSAPMLFVLEAELVGVVRRSLEVHPEHRISSSELAEETETWGL